MKAERIRSILSYIVDNLPEEYKDKFLIALAREQVKVILGEIQEINSDFFEEWLCVTEDLKYGDQNWEALGRLSFQNSDNEYGEDESG